MQALISWAITRSRATLLLLVFLLVAGWAAYVALPKESYPDVPIPFIYISIALEGVSPEDAERLLVRPMEQELRALANVKKMTGIAVEGHASVLLEFDAGFDPERALQNVRDKVDNARPKLPGAAEVSTHEVNTALFPVLSIGLSGALDDVTLLTVARRLQDEMEGLPGILEVNIAGEREDLLEILVDPLALESYGLDYNQLYNLVARNNQLVAAGSLDTGAGRTAMKVPGVIEALDDLLRMPVKTDGTEVVTFGDIATLQRSFKDPEGFARINGQPALVLDVTKRSGANVIETVQQVRALMQAAAPLLPEALEVHYILDQSIEVQNTLTELLNNVLVAVLLVILPVLAAIGLRSALLVGVTIPAAFLVGILCIWVLGYTLNMMVLFSLILVAGLLVDGTLVVAELADRYLDDGLTPAKAWYHAANRMAWPVVSGTSTTLVVFLPLLFWPGMVGEFMKYLPITVLLCLLASLAMALVFLPALGSVSGGYKPRDKAILRTSEDIFAERDNPSLYSRSYRWLLQRLLRFPGYTLLGVSLLVVLIYLAYGRWNHGMDFFPNIEPESAQVQIRARGDLSLHEKDALVRTVENRLLGMPEIKALYARSMAAQGGGSDNAIQQDTVGIIQYQFIDWHERRPARLIMDEMRERTADIPGLLLEFNEQEQGPPTGKPVVLEISGIHQQDLETSLEYLRGRMQELGGFTDVQDDRSLPGIEWRLLVDREAAARFGADVATVGSAIQLITHGLLLSTYRPADSTDEVDIRIRFPAYARSLDQLQRMMLQTASGQVPLSEFVRIEPGYKTAAITRLDGRRTLTLQADLQPGYRLDERLNSLRPYFSELPEGVSVRTAGEDADMQETLVFLVAAFFIAFFLMLVILLLQFNSWYQTLLVLSAIVFSTAGILLGLLVTAQPFGLVMVGMGTIALSGIVINNNIVLIDTYNYMRQQGLNALDAAIETGCLRLRPVFLTAITTILALLPMVIGLNVNLFEPSLGWNAPSTQWWRQLSSAIAGGLAFATLLTLVLTPCLLVLREKLPRLRKKAAD